MGFLGLGSYRAPLCRHEPQPHTEPLTASPPHSSPVYDLIVTVGSEQDSGCAYCTSLGLALNETDVSTGEECGSNPNCWGPFRTALTDTLPSEHGAIDSDNMWHMLTLTTHPEGGNGYSVYIDGVLRSSSPFKNAGVDNFDWRLRGGA